MGRRKRVKLAFITNRSTRKATYKKRSEGLQKKVRELTILCGIDACSIVYNPFDSKPEVWPNPLGVQQVIERFRSLPEFEQQKKMLNEETMVTQRISKLQEQLNKKYMENHQMELNELLNHCLADKSLAKKLMPKDKRDLELIVEKKVKEVNRRLEDIKKGASDHQQPLVTPAPQVPAPGPMMPNTKSTMLPGQEMIKPLLQRFTPAVEIESLPGLFVREGRLNLFLPPS